MQKKAIKEEQCEKRGVCEKHTEKTKNKKANINPSIPIIILYVNGLNNPIKRQRLTDQNFFFKKIQLHGDHRRHNSDLVIQIMKIDMCANSNHKKAGHNRLKKIVSRVKNELFFKWDIL